MNETTTPANQDAPPKPESEATLAAPSGSARRIYGDDPMDWASNMAACAAQRALTRDWKEHPMFGIAVDTDKWAVAYQTSAAKLKAMVSAPNDQAHARPNASLIDGHRMPDDIRRAAVAKPHIL